MFRATLTSLLSRKARLLLSGFAVVLGVMAVSGALIVTDTIGRSFEALFATVNAHVDVQVTGRSNVAQDGPGGDATEPLPADLVDQIADVPGVEDAIGTVLNPGVRVIGPDGKVLVNQGPPTFGVDWPSLTALGDLVELREGRAPHTPDEVALSADLASRAKVTVGDPIDVITLRPRQTYTVVGVFGYSGGRDTIFGESRVAFDTATAQQRLVGMKDHFTAINVTASEGTTPEQLRDDLTAALGDDVTVRTGDEVADAQAAATGQWVELIRQVLLGFAAVALLVGVFLILNTFSILINQRTGELAVLRSLGASQGQIIGSVLIEAVVIGVVAATVGLGAGFGLAAGLKAVMQSVSGARLPIDGLTVPPMAIVAGYAVGLLVTVVAALLPAIRASRVPPVVAMRRSEASPRPVTGFGVAGGALLAAGPIALGFAVVRDAPPAVLIAGVVTTFLGTALLTPALTRPVVSTLGRAVAWGAPGELGRRNSVRNPRRTAITATALMVGVCLVTGAGVLTSSLQASITGVVPSDLKADLVIASGASGTRNTDFLGYDPAVIDRARDLDGVAAAEPLRTDPGQVGNTPVRLGAGSLVGLAPMFGLAAVDGELRDLRSGEVAVSERFATDQHLAVGDRMRVATARGGEHSYTVAVVVTETELLPPVLLSPQDADTRFRSVQPTSGYLTLTEDADPAAVRDQVAALLASDPDFTVVDQTGYAAQQASQVDTFAVMLWILSGLAIVIAVLGIVNTLALSTTERTREIGLLRAVGLGRSQVRWMVTAESVVIAVFGATLGVLVGGGLGVAAARALDDAGIDQVALPWSTMGLTLVGAVLVGLVAAVIPAARASRIDVLRAIAYE